MQQWHLDIQRELFRNTVATISYVGTKGTHLTLQRDLNQLYPGCRVAEPVPAGTADNRRYLDSPTTNNVDYYTLPNGTTIAPGSPIFANLSVACGNDPNPYRPNYPGYGTITGIEPTANSNYNALQVSARRTQGRLSLSLAYTWSHSLDDASDRFDSNFVNSYDPHGNYASSNFDQRHVLTASWVYDLPVLQGTRMETERFWAAGSTRESSSRRAELHSPSWMASSLTAPGWGTATAPEVSRIWSEIRTRVSGPIYSSDPSIKGPLLFNPDAFAETTGLTQGSSGRNVLNNPGRWNFDMALYKNFKLNERFNLEFRTEAFNVFNHTQWVAGSIASWRRYSKLAGQRHISCARPVRTILALCSLP